jgi:threonine dehydratase
MRGSDMVGREEVERAFRAIRPFVHKTPVFYSRTFSELSGADVYLKAENLQKTGSFKVRGAFNKIQGVAGMKVIAASMGNHAQGVAYAAGILGKKARIVMPITSSIVKQEATEGYGAEVVLHGETFKDALEYARSQREYEFIHAYDDEAVIAGQGTIGLEIAEDVGEIDFLLVPVGGGGLIAGISACYKSLSPDTRVIGVQTVSAPSAYRSFRAKKLTEATPAATIADGIAVGRVGEKAFQVMRSSVDDVILVDEEPIATAILLFLERKKLVVEGAGAVPLAALMENRERFRGKRVVLVISGGNIDFTLIDRIIHKGLVSSGRMGIFEVAVEDVPGRLHSLTGIIAGRRGNILNVVHDRLAPDLPVGKTRLTFTVEIRGKVHLEEILEDLKRRGFEVGRSSYPSAG